MELDLRQAKNPLSERRLPALHAVTHSDHAKFYWLGDEIATAEWVRWFSTYRPHGALGGTTPDEFQADHFNAMPLAA